ncbi:hypothetical protein BJ165DRAFT_1474993 [Panaeolus papilionaceus]|nr:hypothetical protein BJ165DRAFT_1474993 [Panaeolus papilionaceus]
MRLDTAKHEPSQPIWSSILLSLTYILVFFILPVPLTGVLVRWRANYSPKSIRLEDDEQLPADLEQAADRGTENRVGPSVNSYLDMFVRVYRLEGVAGYFKGVVPMLTFHTLVTLLPQPDRYNKNNRVPWYAIQLTDLIYLLCIFTLSVVTMTIVYRTVVSNRISYFLRRTTQTMNDLLTPSEVKNILTLYRAPGLSSAWLVYLSIVILYVGPEHRMLSLMLIDEAWRTLRRTWQPLPDRGYYVVEWLLRFLGLSVVSVCIMTPLEVVLVRLSVQRKGNEDPGNNQENEPNSGSDMNSTDQSQTEDVVARDRQEEPLFSASDEDVINVHPDCDAYKGLVDCTRRIAKEEGLATLLRGWWITLLFRGFFISLL